jgi:hypothetical protein
MRAERAAARVKVSRSELYSRALAAYLREHDGERVTRDDRVLQGQPSRLDPVLVRAQAASIGPDEGSFDDWSIWKPDPPLPVASVDDIRRDEVWWVDLAPEPRGSEPGGSADRRGSGPRGA